MPLCTARVAKTTEWVSAGAVRATPRVLGLIIAAAFESPLANDIGVWLAISSESGDIPDIRLALSATGVRAFGPCEWFG